MLRAQLGDAAFLKMLGALVQKKRYQSVTTDEFRRLAAGFLPPRTEDPQLELFFDQWVYGTGVPSLKLNYKVSGAGAKTQVRGAIQQSEAGDEFAAMVPIEIQFAGKRTQVRWVRVSSDESGFQFDLPQKPAKLTLNPGGAILTRD
jgi:aminopeptidase N